MLERECKDVKKGIFDHDIAYYLVENNGEIVFYRTYLSEMKTDVLEDIVIDDRVVSWTSLLIPSSNFYISYTGYEPRFLEITQQLKDDINKCYSLYEKYGIELTDEVTEALERALNDPTNADVNYRSILLKEYGVDKYAKYEYNTITKETTIISYEEEYANEDPLF